MGKKWTKQDLKILAFGVSEGWTRSDISKMLKRTEAATSAKALKEGLLSKNKVRKTYEQYSNEIPKEFKVLEPYKNNRTSILHQHTCGHTWKVRPSHILRGSGCPKCTKHGFNPGKPAIAYLIHFYALGIYKIGITNRSVEARFKSEPQPYEILMVRRFEKGEEALNIEREWLDNLKHYLYNSGELLSGNSETFTEVYHE